jgi:hypothetical protein
MKYRLLIASIPFFVAVNVSAESALIMQTGQTPSNPNIATVGRDGAACQNNEEDIVGCGIPWAYNDSEPTIPAVRFSRDETDCAPGDFVIIDNLTGLIWLGDADDYYSDDAQEWDDALDPNEVDNVVGDGNPNNFNYCGYNDWRMPNVNELSSLMNYAEDNQADWLNGDPNGDGSNIGFDNIESEFFWTSSTTSNDSDNAWLVGFRTSDTYDSPGGQISARVKTADRWVLPVRGPSSD